MAEETPDIVPAEEPIVETEVPAPTPEEPEQPAPAAPEPEEEAMNYEERLQLWLAIAALALQDGDIIGYNQALFMIKTTIPDA